LKPLPLEKIARMTRGTLVEGEPSGLVRSVSTDTRTVGEGALFVALVGDRFDAHDFLDNAVSSGAVALLVSEKPGGGYPAEVAVIEVADTLLALQDLAREYRRLLGVKGVAVTGSSGKTSTKDMIAAVLGQRYQVRATRGNFNNHIGLPLTLLEMEEGDEIGVWEMGMNHPGEIGTLAAIAEPDVAVVTNIGSAHLEFMGSQEAIAKEKGSLAAAISKEGRVVLNADDPFTPSIADRCVAPVTTAGIGGGDVQASGIVPGAESTTFGLAAGGEAALVTLPVPGRHMVRNATLAATTGLHFELEIREIAAGLAALDLTSGRLQTLRKEGVQFLDDSYNANPESMRAALETLRDYPCSGRRFAVLGKMAELGERAEAEHRALGIAFADKRVDVLATVGSEARVIAEAAPGDVRAEHFETPGEAAAFLASEVADQDVVLVKGSRSAAMEKVIEEFARS